MTILLYILVQYQKKKIKCVAEQKILTVEELCRNVLSKKCAFIFVITLRNW